MNAPDSLDPFFLSVCIPAYNEQATIEQVIREHQALLMQIPPTRLHRWEIVCVDDASTDQTLAILQRLAQEIPQLRYLHHPHNRGITQAFATVFNAAQGTHIYLTAADRQWPVTNLQIMLEELCTGQDLVVGVRVKRYQVYSLARELISRVFNGLSHALFGIQTQDAGSIKLGLKALFTLDLISTSPFIEAERLIVAHRQQYRVSFVPIEFLPRRDGKAAGAEWHYLISSLYDCGRCLWYYRRRKNQP